MSNPRTYTIRGLDLTTHAFNCMGELKDQPGFIEIADVKTEAKAVELLLTHPVLSGMVAIPPVKSESRVDVLNIKAQVFVNGTGEAKKLRKQLAEEIKTWAEKSRVRGVRGWRAHALKTPKIAREKNGAGYELDFDAILGHAVFYTDKTLSVGNTDNATFINDTIADLKRHLAKSHPGLIGSVQAEHAATDTVVQA